jgi:carbon-monoxide dehydrogenase large subunit
VATTRSVGTAALRIEDKRILTGRGRYVDDVALPGMLHAAFVRSPFAHARIVRIDASAAMELPGVHAVYTGADIAERTNPLEPISPPEGFLFEAVPALALERTRFVGDPVALVVADSRYLAEDACELVEVDYEPLKPVVSIEDALDASIPAIFQSLPGNVVFDKMVSSGPVDELFSRADIVFSRTFKEHRVAAVPMECRGGVAEYSPATGKFTLHASTQSPHSLRLQLAKCLGLPLDRTQVVNADIGGAFGLKISHHREEIALCAASFWLGQPVKWMEDRNEHLLAAGQARDEQLTLEAALTSDGRILAMRGDLVVDSGSYVGVPFTAGTTAVMIGSLVTGPYDIQACAVNCRVVVSNKATRTAYRGPWAMETWARERLLDIIAHELQMDPADIRRRNFVRGDEGDRMPTGLSLEGITSAETLERSLSDVGYGELRELQARAKEEGRYLGVGFATYIEAAPGPLEGRPRRSERARVVMQPDGHAIIYTSQVPHGQGHETTLRQVASDELGIPMEHITVAHGDTQTTPFALVGTGGSLAATMANGAVLYASRAVKDQLLRAASELLEVAVDDLEVSGGEIFPVGVPSRKTTVSEVAMRAYMNPALLGEDREGEVLSAVFDYSGGKGGWSGGTHLCVVEVDIRTGRVSILQYLVVEDCGQMVNPAIVEGQIRGGIAQGIGEVLLEQCVYDSEGNFLAGTFMDYLLPTSSEVPPIEIVHLESPPNDEVSFRGVGEGGLLVAPAALTNAIEDALRPFGVEITEQYLPPSRIVELVGAE